MANQRSSTQIETKMLSYIVRQTLDAFGIDSLLRTTSYHPQEDGFMEWFNSHSCRYSEHTLTNRLTESNNYHQLYVCKLHIRKYASGYIHQQAWPLLFSCLVDRRKTSTTPGQQPRPFACPSWQSCRTWLNPIWFLQQRTSRPTAINNPVQRLSTQVARNECNGQRQASLVLDGMEVGV